MIGLNGFKSTSKHPINFNDVENWEKHLYYTYKIKNKKLEHETRTSSGKHKL